MNCLKTGKKLLKEIFLSSYQEKTPPIYIIYEISLASMLTKDNKNTCLLTFLKKKVV